MNSLNAERDATPMMRICEPNRIATSGGLGNAAVEAHDLHFRLGIDTVHQKLSKR